MTVRLRCISPMGARDLSQIPAVARIVEVGEEIDVPDDVAGAPAGTYREPTAAEQAAFDAHLLGGLRTRGGDIGPGGEERPLEVRDPGSGLLAQPEHWQVVQPEAETAPAPAKATTPKK